MDEPLSNLDARLRVQMRTELAELHKRLGATFVYVTHDEVEAMTMSDRVALMEAGRILQLGTPAALYDRPASIGVARLIGSPPINLLAPPDTLGALPVTLRRAENLGAEWLLHTATRGGETLVARVPATAPVPERFSLAIDPARLHLFGADGMRIDIPIGARIVV